MLNPSTSIATGTITAVVPAGTSVPISALPAPSTSEYTLCLQVTELKSASGVPGAIFVIEDSVDAFTNKIAQYVFNVSGNINLGSGGVIQKRRISEDIPNLRIGTASAVIRANVPMLTGTTPSCTYAIWIE